MHSGGPILLAVTILAASAGCKEAVAPGQQPGGPGVMGLVWHDADGNGERNDREKGLARVIVSNGRDVVLTDVRGRWLLPNYGLEPPFVIAPEGWRTLSVAPGQIALERWTASPKPTIAVGLVDQRADRHLGLDVCDVERPEVEVIGPLVLVRTGARFTQADARWLEAVAEHVGPGRPAVLLHATPDRPEHFPDGLFQRLWSAQPGDDGLLVTFNPDRSAEFSWHNHAEVDE